MTDAELKLQAQVEALAAHVRALQALVTVLGEHAFNSEDSKEAGRERALERITTDALPLRHSDDPSRDEHALAQSSLRELLAYRRRMQLPLAN